MVLFDIELYCSATIPLLSSSIFPDSKVHGANMGPTWVLSAPDGPHVGPMNLAIRVAINDMYKYVAGNYYPILRGLLHVQLN